MSRIFGGRAAAKGDGQEEKKKPAKMKLGQNNQFFYDEKLKCWRLKGEEPPNVADLAPPPPPKRSLTGNFDQAAHNEGQGPPQIPQSTGQTDPAGRNAFRNTARVRPRYPVVGNFTTQGSAGLGVPGLPSAGQEAKPTVNLFVPTAGAVATSGTAQAQQLSPTIESSVHQALTRSIQSVQEPSSAAPPTAGRDTNQRNGTMEIGEAVDDELERRDAYGQELGASLDEIPDDDDLHLESASGYQTPHSTSSFMNFRSPDGKDGLTSDMVPPRTFAEAVAINEGCSDVEAEFGSDTEADTYGEQAPAQQSIPAEVDSIAVRENESPPCPAVDWNSGWFYRDLYGVVQGPFQTSELKGWREYLPKELRVWQAQEELYWELHLLLSASSSAVSEQVSNGAPTYEPIESTLVSESAKQVPQGSHVGEEDNAGEQQGLHHTTVASDELVERTVSDMHNEFAERPTKEEHDKTLEVGGPTAGEGVYAMGSEISYLQRHNKELQAEIESLRTELEDLRQASLLNTEGNIPSDAADQVNTVNAIFEEPGHVEDQQSQMSDLLTCLGQEGAKIERLKGLLMEKGMSDDELDQILEAVEEEYGFDDIQGLGNEDP
uniref:GYF domain-containing protein n=1 Tax=Picocystis salinarum TaxID=88271 RepID=A0A7S3UER5_9CHLO